MSLDTVASLPCQVLEDGEQQGVQYGGIMYLGDGQNVGGPPIQGGPLQCTLRMLVAQLSHSRTHQGRHISIVSASTVSASIVQQLATKKHLAH